MNICQNGLESQLLARVLPRLDDLKAGTPYELSEIVGDDFWAPLNDGARRGLGRTHSRLVAAGAIPLIYLGKTGENHNIYTRPA